PRRVAEVPGPKPRRQTASRHSPLIHYHAAWVLPISEPPIRDGWVTVDRNRVVAVSRRPPSRVQGGEAGAVDAAIEIDLGNVALMPGLVNAHTHLELSYL